MSLFFPNQTKGPQPPVIVTLAANNKRYVRSFWTWVEIDDYITLDMVMEEYSKLRPYKAYIAPVTRVKHTVGNYEVVIDLQNGNSCTCVGFSYHRNCKHIKSVLATQN